MRETLFAVDAHAPRKMHAPAMTVRKRKAPMQTLTQITDLHPCQSLQRRARAHPQTTGAGGQST